MIIKVYKDILIVYLIGDVDQHKVSSIVSEIDKKMNELRCRNLIFDFSQVDFMDSSGIGMVLSKYKSLSTTNGELKICNISDNNMRLFDMVGLKKIIKIHNNVDECIMGF